MTNSSLLIEGTIEFPRLTLDTRDNDPRHSAYGGQYNCKISMNAAQLLHAQAEGLPLMSGAYRLVNPLPGGGGSIVLRRNHTNRIPEFGGPPQLLDLSCGKQVRMDEPPPARAVVKCRVNKWVAPNGGVFLRLDKVGLISIPRPVRKNETSTPASASYTQDPAGQDFSDAINW